MRLLAAALAVAGASAPHSGAVAGEDAGREAFAPCRACHSLAKDAGTMAGPSLSGLIGRAVGGDPAFDYSPVLRAAHAGGLVWTLRRLEAFLADPEGMFPGMWMSYPGIRDEAERAGLARYVATAGTKSTAGTKDGGGGAGAQRTDFRGPHEFPVRKNLGVDP